MYNKNSIQFAFIYFLLNFPNFIQPLFILKDYLQCLNIKNYKY